jgi:hypothetical protein
MWQSDLIKEIDFCNYVTALTSRRLSPSLPSSNSREYIYCSKPGLIPSKPTKLKTSPFRYFTTQARGRRRPTIYLQIANVNYKIKLDNMISRACDYMYRPQDTCRLSLSTYHTLFFVKLVSYVIVRPLFIQFFAIFMVSPQMSLYCQTPKKLFSRYPYILCFVSHRVSNFRYRLVAPTHTPMDY